MFPHETFLAQFHDQKKKKKKERKKTQDIEIRNQAKKDCLSQTYAEKSEFVGK